MSREAYRKLAQKLDSLPNRYPATESGVEILLLEKIFTPQEAVLAAEQLEKEGISVRVVNVSSLKPINEDEIKAFAANVKGIVTAEEHSLIGGLADVITYILRGIGIPTETIGIEDQYGTSDHNYDELLEAYGLTVEKIVETVKKVLN